VSNQLKKNIEAVNIVLDEKKCGNMKMTIEHIQERLRHVLGLNKADMEKTELDVQSRMGHRPTLKQKELPSSDEEDED
jgi:gamma-glutamyl phosphate reductase